MILSGFMFAGKLLIKPIVTRGKVVPHAFHVIIEFGEDFQALRSDFTEENSDNHIKFVQLALFGSVIQQFTDNNGNKQYFNKYKGNISYQIEKYMV